MKNTIILFFVMTAYLFSQGWNNTVTTTINEPNLVKMDLFTNKDGNHIIVQNSNSTNSIKYYLLNSSGTVVRSSTIETSGNAEFPNISGDNDKVYLVYKLGSYLKAKKSTDAGQNWNNFNIPSQYIGSNTCNGVDIVYDYQGLHVVYAMKDSDPFYETYYYKLNSSNSWVDYKNVTDYGSEVGGFPTVTTSTDRVHVSYNTDNETEPTVGQGEVKSRDKYNSDWQTPQLVFGGGDGLSSIEKVFSDGTNLFNFYYKFVAIDPFNWRNDLYVKKRLVGGTSWSSSTLLDYYANSGNLITVDKTADGKIHVVYEYWSDPSTKDLKYKSFDGANWGNDWAISYGALWYKSPKLASVSNDLFVVYRAQSSNYVKYRQYDAAPLVPQNLAVSVYTVQDAQYPRLSWTLNNEPDVLENDDGYLIERRTSIAGDPWSNWSQIGYTGGGVSTYIDYGIGTAGDGFNTAQYRIRAKDVGNYTSDYSSSVQIAYGHQGMEKKGVDIMPNEYLLAQNYPNPFNPTTRINYQLPVAGNVSLKVIDMLGKEVAELVNETKEAGYYEVEFDASNLPSGVYFYRLQAGNYVETKKMLLLR